MSSAPKLALVPPDAAPPYNLEAEGSALGSMLLDNDAIDDLAAFLKPEHFFRDANQALARRIFALHAAGSPVDPMTLADDLERAGELERAGGHEAIRDAIERTPHAVNAVYYGQIVKQKAIARSLIAAATGISGEAYSNRYSADELLQRAEDRVYAIGDEDAAGDTTELSEALLRAAEAHSRRCQGEVLGLRTGFDPLDEMIGGLQPGRLVIIAGRPGMGKTRMALNICEFNALGGWSSPYLVSLEMGAVELADCLVQSVARVGGHYLSRPDVAPREDLLRIDVARSRLAAASFPVDDTPGRTLAQVAANARRLKARRGVGLLVIDYLQLIEPDDPSESRQEQVAKISRRLKILSRELQVPVIALSQINRQSENREDRRPRLSDLRESGAIEQDADQVILVHRPSYYDPNDQPGIAEVIVAKNRHGATGTVRLEFHGAFARFDSPGSRMADY